MVNAIKGEGRHGDEIHWEDFRTFMTGEFTKGVNMLQGDYVLPGGQSLPFALIIKRLKRHLLLKTVMEGGEERDRISKLHEDISRNSKVCLKPQKPWLTLVESCEDLLSVALCTQWSTYSCDRPRQVISSSTCSLVCPPQCKARLTLEQSAGVGCPRGQGAEGEAEEAQPGRDADAHTPFGDDVRYI
jgi:hypothetical protein